MHPPITLQDHSPSLLADVVGSLVARSLHQRLKLLCTVDVVTRLDIVYSMLHKHLDASGLPTSKLSRPSRSSSKGVDNTTESTKVARSIMSLRSDTPTTTTDGDDGKNTISDGKDIANNSQKNDHHHHTEMSTPASSSEQQKRRDEKIDARQWKRLPLSRSNPNESISNKHPDNPHVLYQRIKSLNPPREVLEAAERECQRLGRMNEHHPSYAQSVAYLELLGELPWNCTAASVNGSLPSPAAAAAAASNETTPTTTTTTTTAATCSHHPTLAMVQSKLDANHCGLDDLKRRVVQHVAVQNLRDWDGRAPILCLVGPPGTGKTSIAQSIAASLHRPFVRISLGGVRDEAEIRGHRRTYVGAMPGRLIQAMRRAKVCDPVILLDEVDKTGRDGRGGDPAAALLEALDPEQNAAFVDTYLNVPFDLSKAMFIATANNADEIPPPLLDRLEVIGLRAYTREEKMDIALEYLLPKVMREHGLATGETSTSPKLPSVEISRGVMGTIIDGYTREAGVRQLARCLASVCRHIAVEVVTQKENGTMSGTHRDACSVDDALLQLILGPPRFPSHDPYQRVSSPGSSAGLVWTSTGGQVQYIECISIGTAHSTTDGNITTPGTLTLTGRQGEILEESSRVALSWVRAHAAALGFSCPARTWDIHVHLPAGATPKDGPSAGITIAVALVSLLSGRCVRGDTAMTGELTLRGHVLPVGGIKEKILAAYAAGLRRVIVPAKNIRDVQADVPEKVRNEMEYVGVEKLEEVLKNAFDPPYELIFNTNGGKEDAIDEIAPRL